MSGITSRIFDGHLVRFINKPDGLWVVASDLAEPMGFANIRDSIAKIVPEKHRADVAIGDTSSNGVTQRRSVTILSEAGLYRLLFASRKPAAQKFTDWVTEEVLPAIRRQGFYAAAGANALVARSQEAALLRARAKLLRRQAQQLEADAQLLADLPGAATVADTLRERGLACTGSDLIRAVVRCAAFARRHLLPVGRDRRHRMTMLPADVAAALGLDQTTLNLEA